jgi:hypothetical protein
MKKATTLTAAFVLAIVPATAEAGELWAAFHNCMTDAIAAESLIAPLIKPQRDKGILAMRCRGESASRLFAAMAAVGKQDSASGVNSRISEAVQCFRFSGSPATHECMVTIAVGTAFLDGL